MKEEIIVINNLNCKIIRSGRKTAAIEISENAEVIFRVPKRMPRKEIEEMFLRHKKWINEKLIKRNEQKKYSFTPNSEQEEALRNAAKAYIPERVRYWSKITGLNPTGIKITSAKKRFGSCNSKNSLCFSLMLMLYPEEAIDYVIVHELTHIVHKNHGRDFYALVKKLYPDYKNAEAALKKPPLPMHRIASDYFPS